MSEDDSSSNSYANYNNGDFGPEDPNDILYVPDYKDIPGEDHNAIIGCISKLHLEGVLCKHMRFLCFTDGIHLKHIFVAVLLYVACV